MWVDGDDLFVYVEDIVDEFGFWGGYFFVDDWMWVWFMYDFCVIFFYVMFEFASVVIEFFCFWKNVDE